MTPRGASLDLSPDDRRLLDALVDCGFEPDALEAPAPNDRRRVDAIAGLFELLEDYPVDDADDTLVHATLARVDRAERDRSARMSYSAHREGAERARRRIRMPDFISVAAIILIGTSIVWPMSNFIRTRAVDAGCANNLRRMGLAFDQYANDFNGRMPSAQAGLFNAFGPSSHNGLNLDPLTNGGYCDAGPLNCPGHEGSFGESYSYQWQVPGRPALWSAGPVTLVLGDRNPLIDAYRDGRMVPPLTISLSHGGRGQNVLTSDAVVIWLEQPVVRRDNIWLPGHVLFLRDGLEPTDPADAFLAH